MNFISRLFPLLYFLQGCGQPEQTNDDSLLKNEEFPSLEIVDEENLFSKNKKKTEATENSQTQDSNKSFILSSGFITRGIPSEDFPDENYLK